MRKDREIIFKIFGKDFPYDFTMKGTELIIRKDKFNSDGTLGKMIDRDKEDIIRKFQKAGIVAKPNNGGGVTAFIKESVNEAWSTYEQKMVNQILRAKKDGTPIFQLPMKTQEFYRKHRDKFNESVNETNFAHSKGGQIEVGKDYIYTQGKRKRTIKIKGIDPKKGVRYYDFSTREYMNIPVSTWNNTKAGHYMTPIKESVNEALEPKDYFEIRELIRQEIATVFFDLYKKKAVWTKG